MLQGNIIKVFWLYCSREKLLKKQIKKNLKLIKNTLPNKSGNPKN